MASKTNDCRSCANPEPSSCQSPRELLGYKRYPHNLLEPLPQCFGPLCPVLSDLHVTSTIHRTQLLPTAIQRRLEFPPEGSFDGQTCRQNPIRRISMTYKSTKFLRQLSVTLIPNTLNASASPLEVSSKASNSSMRCRIKGRVITFPLPLPQPETDQLPWNAPRRNYRHIQNRAVRCQVRQASGEGRRRLRSYV